MVAAIPASTDKTDALIDDRFGRCPFFCFYNSDKKEVNFIVNEKKEASSGVGPQVAEFLASKGANRVYTMEIGPKAQTMLEKLNIRVEIVKTKLTIQELITSI